MKKNIGMHMNHNKSIKASIFIMSSMTIPLLLNGCSPTRNTTQPIRIVDHTNNNQYQNTFKNHSNNTQKKPPYNYTLTPIHPNYQTQKSQQSYPSFGAWKSDFARRAKAKGYSAYDVEHLMNIAQYKSRVVSFDNNQAEFVKMPWEYVESAASDTRVNNGRKKFSSNSIMLSRISDRYGVSPYIVSAIWGMESAYGSVTGNTNLASSLSTLAYDGRRRKFAEDQLLSLLTLISRGDVSWSNMDGSWAGGMGHTQFIPSTWIAQSVDGNNDGYRSPWLAADALASTANYLHNSGWIQGLSPYIEVRLPDGFDYSQTNLTKTLGNWKNLGIQLLENKYIHDSIQTKLWLPAGQQGPALLLTRNFDVIKKYNNSSSYALGISLLARRIAYQSELQQPWPKHEQPLTKYQVKKLQQRLTNAGYNTHGMDGVIGPNTRKAFQRWQKNNGKIADGFISKRTAQSLIW